MIFYRRLAVLLALVLPATVPVSAQELRLKGTPVPAPESEADFAGSWGGSIMISGTPVGILIELTEEPDGWKGTLDIPSQGVVRLELTDIQVEGNAIRMTIPAPSLPTFQGSVEGDRLAGTFTQHGNAYGFSLERGAGPGPNRPQTPKPPFPYVSEAVTVTSGDVRLSGTFTHPRGEGPFPAVIFVSGSGPQDRNLEIFGHKPYLLLADRLTRAGLATLRWDDRGVGGSSGVLSEATTLDLAEDVLAGVRFLRTRNTVDGARIAVLGHSEGAAVAAVAAARSRDVNALVLLAGMGVTGREVLIQQASIVARAKNVPEDFVRMQAECQERLFDAVVAGAPEDTLRARTVALMKTQLPTPRDDEIRARLGEELARLQSPWFRHFLDYDPKEALRRVTVPVLALTGERDVQVSASLNLPPMKHALEEAGNTDVTAEILPGLNHLFQESLTGKFEEYAGNSQTMSPGVLDRIVGWLRDRLNAT